MTADAIIRACLSLWCPQLPHGYSYKASIPVPDRVKPSFVIFDIRALWRSALSVRVPGCHKLQMTVWHRMLYSCTRMAAVGIKGKSSAVVKCVVRYQLLWWHVRWHPTSWVRRSPRVPVTTHASHAEVQVRRRRQWRWRVTSVHFRSWSRVR